MPVEMENIMSETTTVINFTTYKIGRFGRAFVQDSCSLAWYWTTVPPETIQESINKDKIRAGVNVAFEDLPGVAIPKAPPCKCGKPRAWRESHYKYAVHCKQCAANWAKYTREKRAEEKNG